MNLYQAVRKPSNMSIPGIGIQYLFRIAVTGTVLIACLLLFLLDALKNWCVEEECEIKK
jgi:hypothetical protein